MKYGLKTCFGKSLAHKGHLKPLTLCEFTEGVNSIEKCRVLSCELWTSIDYEFEDMGRKPTKMSKIQLVL